MSFVNKVTENSDDKKFLCYIIAKLIPDLNDLSMSELTNMLKFVSKAVGTIANTENQAETASNEVHNLALKLERPVITKMMENLEDDIKNGFVIEKFNKVKKTNQKVNEIEQYSLALQQLRSRLSLYNQFKKSLTGLSEIDQTELRLDQKLERNFVRQTITRIREIENVMGGLNEYCVFDTTRENPSEEQLRFDELVNPAPLIENALSKQFNEVKENFIEAKSDEYTNEIN